MSVFIIAEVGINHNGDIDLAKRLIDGAVFAGCDAVKFQKRTIERVYTKEELDMPRESPWGTTNREQKEGLEFGQKEYDEIVQYCRGKSIVVFASAWDTKSQKFLQQYDFQYNKVASAMLTHKKLLEMIAAEQKHTFISTGMSTFKDIERAISVFEQAGCSYELMHCSSEYPMKNEDVNLRVIPVLAKRFGCNVGYSGHEVGLVPSAAAVAFGISSLERHITLDRAMYGSDQAASVEVMGFHRLVGYVRTIEQALGDGQKRVSEKEIEIAKKLRRVNTV